MTWKCKYEINQDYQSEIARVSMYLVRQDLGRRGC